MASRVSATYRKKVTRILESLADKSPGIEGMKLSRFDKVLGLNRERIERVYRGRRLRVALAA